MNSPARADGGTLRLFVAVELPDEVKRSLVETIDGLKREGAPNALRWVRPDGIHITLKFLGAVPEASVPSIVGALRGALASLVSFELRPEHVVPVTTGRCATSRYPARETYPSTMRMIWVGVGGDVNALMALATRVEAALQPLGYPAEGRAFNAHLTLARMREQATREERERAYAAVRAFEAHALPSFTVDHTSLMRSTLQPGGAVYRALEVFPLART